MRTVQRTFHLNESVVAAELDNEMVLLNVETGLYFGLDELGTRIWSLLSAEMNEEAIVDHILAEYDVDRLQVEVDVREFVDHLEAKGLVISTSR